MKESRFIAQNKEKWLESETLLKDSVKDPEKLSTLFTQVVDDLSYSRTYYPNRSVRVYLNQLARDYFSIIYSHKKERKNRFKIFWLDELPQLIIFSRKQMLISLIVFLIALAMGIFSSMKDPQFASHILGENYVNMTKENIKKGDPMAVYKEGHQVSMFLGITFNNLRVAFITFCLGIFFGIGTIAILISNGIMVGCFQYFFVEHDLLAQSAMTIWLHGTLEISCIIIAGGAGLTLGSGLIFPGTYSRFQSFQISAIRSLKLMIGIAPIIVLAAVIESFLTRYTETPDFVKLMLIIGSALFIIGYFVVYPWRKSKQGFLYPITAVRLEPDKAEKFRVDRISNNADILQSVFEFYKPVMNKILPLASAVSLVAAAIGYFLRMDQTVRLTSGWNYFFGNLFYAMQSPDIWFVPLNAAATAVVVLRTSTLLQKELRPDEDKPHWLQPLIQNFILALLAYFIIWGLGFFGAMILIFSFVSLLVAMWMQQYERKNVITSFFSAWSLISTNVGQFFGLQLVLGLMTFSFLIIVSAPLLYLALHYLQWNFAESDLWVKTAIDLILSFIRLLTFYLILPMLTLSSAVLYFSLRETQNAEGLKSSIAGIGSRLTKSSRV